MFAEATEGRSAISTVDLLEQKTPSGCFGRSGKTQTVPEVVKRALQSRLQSAERRKKRKFGRRRIGAWKKREHRFPIINLKNLSHLRNLARNRSNRFTHTLG
jgi:hypothetical protein